LSTPTAHLSSKAPGHLAKDRAAEVLTKVMTREALDYPA